VPEHPGGGVWGRNRPVEKKKRFESGQGKAGQTHQRGNGPTMKEINGNQACADKASSTRRKGEDHFKRKGLCVDNLKSLCGAGKRYSRQKNTTKIRNVIVRQQRIAHGPFHQPREEGESKYLIKCHGRPASAVARKKCR